MSEISRAHFSDLARKYAHQASSGDNFDVYSAAQELFQEFIREVHRGNVSMPAGDEKIFEGRYDLGLSYKKTAAHAGVSEYAARKLLEGFSSDDWGRYKAVIHEGIPYRRAFSAYAPLYNPVLRLGEHTPRKGDFINEGCAWRCIISDDESFSLHWRAKDPKQKKGSAFVSDSQAYGLVRREHMNYLMTSGCRVIDYDSLYRDGNQVRSWDTQYFSCSEAA